VLVALSAIESYIGQFAVTDEIDLTRPLREVRLALSRAYKGEVPPLLTPSLRRHGRPPVRPGQTALVTMAVLAMEAAMTDGMSLDAAAREVAQDIHRRGFLLPGNTIQAAARSIKKWREDASAGPGGHHPDAASALNELRNRYKAGANIKPGGWKAVLDHLDTNDRIFGIPRKIPGKRGGITREANHRPSHRTATARSAMRKPTE
jgi:hypothetical protein